MDIPQRSAMLLDRWSVKVIAWIAAAFILIFLGLVVATSGRMVGYDVLDWIMQYGDSPHDWWAYLWMPHGEHRIAADRLLIAMDIAWFGGTGLPFAVVRTALWLGMFGALAWQIAAMTKTPAGRTILVALLAFALLPTTLVVMCSMPLMGGFIHTCAFSVFAFLLWDNGSIPRQAAALAAAAIASVGVAGGLFAWPVLLYTIWRSGGSARLIVIVSACALIVCGLYVTNLPAHARSQSFDTARLMASVDFVLRFLGLPWSHAPSLVWPGRLIGAIIFCTGGWLMLTDLRARTAGPKAERIGIALLQFSFITALAAAASRWDVATDREMPIRYSVVVALAHAGLLLALSSRIARAIEGRHATMWRGIVAVVALVLLLQQIVVGRAAVAQVNRYADAWSRFAAGGWTPDMTQYVHPDRSRAEQVLAFMKRRHIYGQ